MRDRTAFAAFLRARREALRPTDVGLAEDGAATRRRTPGLRREEVAQLAGITPDYLVRLEQGRDVRPSLSVLVALAHALRLDAAGREHLLALAGAAADPDPAPAGAEEVAPDTLAVLEAVAGPAIVLGCRMDIIAANAGARGLYGLAPGERRNAARDAFLDEPAARRRYPEWERVADETVAHLRLLAGRAPRDPALGALVDELTATSPAFAARWDRVDDVREKTTGEKRIDHPDVGPLSLRFQTLAVAGAPGQHLVVYLPADEATAARLPRLATLRAVA